MKYKERMQHDYERRSYCACGKVSFRKKEAQTKRNSLLRAGKEEYLRIYQCHGGAWHLTKATIHDGEML